MSAAQASVLLDAFLATAERVAAERPEVDLDIAREVLGEAARYLHDGLALDHLDEHDFTLVVAGLCEDLVAADPRAALRTRADAVLQEPGELHDPQGASGAYLVAVTILKL